MPYMTEREVMRALRLEFARAQGMANAMVYARLEARAERRPR